MIPPCIVMAITTALLLLSPCWAENQKHAAGQRSGSATPLVDSDKPGVFISFLRSAEVVPPETPEGPKEYLWFGITNNTRWPIWLDMSEVPKAYGDAELYDIVEDNKTGKMIIDSRCHVCSTNQLGAGRSLTFSLPRDHASTDARLSIEYSFYWEHARTSSGGSYSTHSVKFYFSYLPKSVL